MGGGVLRKEVLRWIVVVGGVPDRCSPERLSDRPRLGGAYLFSPRRERG